MRHASFIRARHDLFTEKLNKSSHTYKRLVISRFTHTNYSIHEHNDNRADFSEFVVACALVSSLVINHQKETHIYIYISSLVINHQKETHIYIYI